MTCLIDDSPVYAMQVASIGIPVLLYDTPWNQGIESPGITRVFSWENVYDMIVPMM